MNTTGPNNDATWNGRIEDSSMRGNVGLVLVLAGGLLAVSYPMITLWMLLGAVGTLAVVRGRSTLLARRRERTPPTSQSPSDVPVGEVRRAD